MPAHPEADVVERRSAFDSLLSRGEAWMCSAAATVESVRLEPELRKALITPAEHDHETTSSVIRKALHLYLKTG